MLVAAASRAAAFVLLGALALVGCGEPARYAPLPSGATVVVLGDSISYGTGARPGQDFPRLLAQETGWRVINAGIPGDTAAAARARVKPLIEQYAPDWMLVELGGNDFLRNRSAAAVREDLRSIIGTIRAAGVEPALIAVPEVSMLRATVGALADSPIYEALAEEEDVLLLPDVISEVLSEDEWRADRIHPNAAGYRALADRLLAQLAAAGLYLPSG